MIKGSGASPLTQKVLAFKKGVNMNSTADQIISGFPAKCVIRKIVVTNASISLTTAAGGIYTSAAKGGTAIVANTQAYSSLTNGSKYIDLTLAAVAGTDLLLQSQVYFSLTTPQGQAATADIYFIGDILP